MFTGDFFAWMGCQLIMIEDFPYDIMDFQGIMDLVLPAREDWDASGKKPEIILSSVFYFKNILFFWVRRRFFKHIYRFIMQIGEKHIR